MGGEGPMGGGLSIRHDVAPQIRRRRVLTKHSRGKGDGKTRSWQRRRRGESSCSRPIMAPIHGVEVLYLTLKTADIHSHTKVSRQTCLRASTGAASYTMSWHLIIDNELALDHSDNDDDSL